MPRVIVSAGHTNEDPGSISQGLREVDLTRSLTRKLIPYLRSNGLITLSIPPNMDLAKRIEWVNGTGYNADLKDIAIELHINDGGKSGFEFWYKGNGANESQDLAEVVMQTVTESTGLPNQGVKSEFDHQYGSLAFLSNTNTISILCECLYIDNPQDFEKLKNESELDKIAQAIAKGILKYVGMPFRTQAGTAPKNLAANARAMAASRQAQPPMYNIPQQTQPVNPIPTKPVLSGNPSMGTNQQRIPVPSSQQPMSRDQRKEMISVTYKKILGREPNEKDLNYFLNIGMTEDKLIKRMIESQEHVDMVNAKKEYDSMKKEFQSHKFELTKLKTENKDAKVMIQKLTELLKQKNAYLSRARIEINSLKRSKPVESTKIQERQYKGKFSDRMFHFFSGILG